MLRGGFPRRKQRHQCGKTGIGGREPPRVALKIFTLGSGAGDVVGYRRRRPRLSRETMKEAEIGRRKTVSCLVKVRLYKRNVIVIAYWRVQNWFLRGIILSRVCEIRTGPLIHSGYSYCNWIR